MNVREEMRLRQNNLVHYLDMKYGTDWCNNDLIENDKRVIEHHKWLKKTRYTGKSIKYNWHDKEYLEYIIRNHIPYRVVGDENGVGRQAVYMYIKSKPDLWSIRKEVAAIE